MISLLLLTGGFVAGMLFQQFRPALIERVAGLLRRR